MVEIAPRDAFGQALTDLGSQYTFMVLDGDLSKGTKTAIFKEKYPDRHINIGIAEANLMGIAAGIASTGMNVFACTFAMFAAGRAYEQVRNSIAYPALNVKIVGTHGGISIGEDGGSHQCIEDLSLMRTLPNLTVLSPADATEVQAAVKAALNVNGPVYLRIYGKGPWPVVFDPSSYVFKPNQGVLVADGDDITLVATGLMLAQSLQARELLLKEGIHARVINIHTLKPIDRAILVEAAQQTGGIVTAEDHNIIGGLGSAVAEALSEEWPTRIARIGLQDTFGRSGKPRDLLRYYRMTPEDIAEKARELLERKATAAARFVS